MVNTTIELACGCCSINGSRYFFCEDAKRNDTWLTERVARRLPRELLSEDDDYMACVLWFDEHFADFNRADA